MIFMYPDYIFEGYWWYKNQKFDRILVKVSKNLLPKWLEYYADFNLPDQFSLLSLIQ